MTSKSVAYSMVKKRVSQLSSVLSITSRACRQATFGGARAKVATASRSWSRIGHVLGVVDRHELAAREGQRDVERPRLGPRLARRRHDALR